MSPAAVARSVDQQVPGPHALQCEPMLEHAIAVGPEDFSQRVSWSTQALTLRFPQQAFQIVGVTQL